MLITEKKLESKPKYFCFESSHLQIILMCHLSTWALFHNYIILTNLTKSFCGFLYRDILSFAKLHTKLLDSAWIFYFD